MHKITYPITQAVDQVDDYHGTPVPDPYRWLEDTDSPQTRAWIEAQNKLTFAFLESIPEREAIRQRLTSLWDFPKAGAPLHKGKRYFQLRNSGLQNQDVLYALDTLDGAPRPLLDPNTLSTDGTVALNAWSVSEDGCWIAYAVSSSGSDWQTWRVRNVGTGEDLPETLEWSKFSGASWLPDSSGFYYCRYEPPVEGQPYLETNYFQQLYFHRLNSPQSEDRLIYHRPDHKEWGFDAHVSVDGRYLVLHVWVGTDIRNLLFYQELGKNDDMIELVSELDASYTFVGNDGSLFYLHTDLEAPRGRLIALDVSRPARQDWQTLIPQGEDTLEHVLMAGNQFICLYLHDAHHRLLRFNLDGSRAGEIELSGMGSIVSMQNIELHGERQDRELFYRFHSFAVPPTAYRFDFETETSQELFKPSIRFDFSPYETRQVFVASKDGTQVPMFLTARREVFAARGPHPTLLYGYGGFNNAVTPAFAVSRLIWLERGGILAIANLRGGSEYGEEWHQAGMKERKQNVFDDFIACAEWLVAQGLTIPAKLAIEGRSNGGLLVGACLTQRPELFGAALPAVGVMDMLRFHKFTIGWAWVSDYGSADDPDGFRYLYAYSPLHNLKPGLDYPATLVTTADHDDRVVPGHSFKFAATLQHAQAGPAPTLIRIQTKAGHGFGKPTAIIIEEQTDQWVFLLKVLGIASS